MKAKDIDKFISIGKKLAFTYDDAKFLYDAANIKAGQVNPIISINEDFNNVMENIMKNIENEGLAYFMSQMDKPENRAPCFILLSHSSRTDLIRYALEKYEKGYETGQMGPSTVTDLVKATKDKEFIKSFIESSDVRKKYKIDYLYQGDIIDFLEIIDDPEYVISLIYNNFSVLNSEGIEEISGTSIVDIFKLTKDPELIKNIIKNIDKKDNIPAEIKEKLKYSKSISKLLVETGDKEFIKSIIEEKEKNIAFIDRGCLVEAIVGTKDSEYIKQIIEDNKKREEIGLKLESDENYSNRHILLKLILETKDSEYIKQILEDKQKREKIGFVFPIQDVKDAYEKNPYIKLLKSTNDKDYIKSVLRDSKKKEEFSINDKEFAEEKFELIQELDDIDFIKELIEDKEKRSEYGLDTESDLVSLIFLTKDQEYIYKTLESINIEKKEQGDLKIILPSNMTIGTEIEAEGYNSKFIIPKYTKEWDCRADGSLEDGVEVVSPILTGDMEKASRDIKDICESMQKFGLEVSQRCGAHVHIGADYLTSQESWSNLTEIWANCEEILYTISNKEGEIPREGVITYARPISSGLEDFIEDTVSEDNIKEFMKATQEGRYYGINFSNVDNDKNTIEFRLANGTIDADTWIENINLFGGIIKAAEDISKIQHKNISEITAEDKNILANFENLKDENISKKEKLNALLSLTIPEQYRQIYVNRFITNSKLIEEDENIYAGITRNVAKDPIDLKEIKNKSLAGLNAVNGVDFDNGSKIIEDDMSYRYLGHEEEISLRRDMTKENDGRD